MGMKIKTPTEEQRFLKWVADVSHPRSGIPEPTPQEIEHVRKARCKYRRAARASAA